MVPEREPEKRLPHPRKAAGAQITHSRHGEVVTKPTDTGPLTGYVIGMDMTLNPCVRSHWRASLVPAAAVIPAPIAYVDVAAVKKLVVGFGGAGGFGRPLLQRGAAIHPRPSLWKTPRMPLTGRSARGSAAFTLKKIECSRQACRPVYQSKEQWNMSPGRNTCG